MLLENKYQLIKKIGEGSFGKVYMGGNVNTGERLAIKIEFRTKEHHILHHEARMYLTLKNMIGIPNMRTFGSIKEYHYLVMDLMEEDFQTRMYKQTITESTLISWGSDILSILEAIHDAGIVHRDIKPPNFAFRSGSIYLIDFGLARFYQDRDGKHMPMKIGQTITGTLRYTSMNVHNGYSASRRDDIASLVYMLIYLFCRKLPWQGVRCETNELKCARIRELKQPSSFKSWCDECAVPSVFNDMNYYSQNIRYDERPNYRFFDIKQS